MKIAFLHYLYDYHGSRVQVGECIRALRGIGHDMAEFDMDPAPAPVSPDGPAARQTLKRWFARYVHEPHSLLKNIPSFIKEWRALREFGPDVVIVRYKIFRFSSLLAARWLGRPVMLWVHGPGAYTARRFERQYLHYPFFGEAVERFTWCLADAIIVVSGELGRMLVQAGAPADRIVIIPNGVDVGRFSPSGDGTTVRDRYGLRDRTVIGFSGILAPWHGIAHLQRIIRELLPRYPQTALLVVGEGAGTATLVDDAASAKVADRVVVTGRVPHDQMPGHLAAMDIAVAPYGAEVPFYHSPLKLFEYMASGCAIVASRIGQIATIVEDGKSALLYDPMDGRQFTQRLAALIEQPQRRRTLGAAARERVQRFSWAQTAKSVEALGTQLMQSRRVPRHDVATT